MCNTMYFYNLGLNFRFEYLGKNQIIHISLQKKKIRRAHSHTQSTHIKQNSQNKFENPLQASNEMHQII